MESDRNLKELARRERRPSLLLFAITAHNSTPLALTELQRPYIAQNVLNSAYAASFAAGASNSYPGILSQLNH